MPSQGWLECFCHMDKYCNEAEPPHHLPTLMELLSSVDICTHGTPHLQSVPVSRQARQGCGCSPASRTDTIMLVRSVMSCCISPPCGIYLAGCQNGLEAPASEEEAALDPTPPSRALPPGLLARPSWNLGLTCLGPAALGCRSDEPLLAAPGCTSSSSENRSMMSSVSLLLRPAEGVDVCCTGPLSCCAAAAVDEGCAGCCRLLASAEAPTPSCCTEPLDLFISQTPLTHATSKH